MVSAATQTEQPVVARSARKRRAILHAARDLFLQKGYAGTSMDEVAALAEVSKVTIYKHFDDKHNLFVAVVTDAIDEAKAGSQSLVDQLGDSTDIGADLRDFARRHAELVTQPHLVQMPTWPAPGTALGRSGATQPSRASSTSSLRVAYSRCPTHFLPPSC